MASEVQSSRMLNSTRGDWHLLLPRPSTGRFKHLVVLGGTSDLIERLEEIGIADQLSMRLPKSSLVDGLAILHDSPIDLPQAARSLATGGSLYYEVQRRSSGKRLVTPHRVARTLRNVGLTPSGAYLVTPNFAEYRQYFPLEMHSALKWYLAERYAPLSLKQYVLGRCIRSLARSGIRHLGSFAPNFAVTATVGEANGGHLAILDELRVARELSSRPIRPVLLTPGIDDGSRIVLIPFTADTKSPSIVLKVPRRPAYNCAIKREQRMLAEIRAGVSACQRDSIPQPLGTFRYEELTVGVESFVPGRSLLLSSWQWRRSIRDKVEDLQLAASWLSEFHRELQVADASWDDDELRRRLDMLIARYVRTFSATSEEERLFADTRAHAEALSEVEVPITRRHIDFVPANVFRDGRSLTVIDWEDRGFDHDPFGPALCDLLHFITMWSAAIRGLHTREEQLQCFRQFLVDPRGREYSVAMARKYVSEYMCALGIDRRLYPVLLIYSVIEHALESANRQQVVGASAPFGRSDNRHVRHLGILAEHRKWLFDEKLLGPI